MPNVTAGARIELAGIAGGQGAGAGKHDIVQVAAQGIVKGLVPGAPFPRLARGINGNGVVASG